MDFLIAFLIVYGCFILYTIYRYYSDKRIIGYISIPYEDDPSIIEDFINKYNNKDVKFIIRGSKCLEWLDKFTKNTVREHQKKEFLNYPFYVKKCIKDIFGIKVEMNKVQYGKGHWKNFMSKNMSIDNIIEYGSYSIKDYYGKEIMIDTLNADLNKIKKAITKFEKGTIVATDSMRIMEYTNFDKYLRLMKIFNILGYEYILLYPKDETYYTTFDMINNIDYPKGRYICMFLEDNKTDITVIDC